MEQITKGKNKMSSQESVARGQWSEKRDAGCGMRDENISQTPKLPEAKAKTKTKDIAKSAIAYAFVEIAKAVFLLAIIMLICVLTLQSTSNSINGDGTPTQLESEVR